ncbi:Leucine carboxyl methyltransferase [Dirofilaria immitis]
MYQEWSHASESSRGVSTLVCTFSLFEFYRKLEFCGQHNFAFVYGACACCLCFCIAKSILGCIALILVSTNFVLHHDLLGQDFLALLLCKGLKSYSRGISFSSSEAGQRRGPSSIQIVYSIFDR